MAERFGRAQSVLRREDIRFVTGRGTYADDVNAEGQAYAHFVRSHDAHGIVRAIDTSAARAVPGVLAVFIGRDLAEAGVEGLPYLPLPGFELEKPVPTPRPALAVERVRYVGEQVAVVIADSKTAAMDAADRVDVTIDPLPAVPTIEQALAPGAPAIWADAPDNVVLRHRFGDRAAIEAAFARAAHVSRLSLVNNRVLANPIEPRAVVASSDGNRFDMSVSSQGVNYYLFALTDGTLRLDPHSIRITTPDVGGAFGVKEFAYPEDIAVLFAARALGRPVKWTGTRAEHFLSDNHARDALIDCALALDENGHFLAIDASIRASLGAYCSFLAPTPPIRNTTLGLPQMYRTPLVGASFDMVATNAAPMGPYRGVGREQGALIVERLIDRAAGELGIDPVELRRRNLIPTAGIPYRTATGRIYESGDFEGLLERLAGLADWDGFTERAEQSRAAGYIRGRGLALFVEPVGGAPFEGARLRFPEDGTVEAEVASQSQGQGHETTLAQVIAEKLGVALDQVRIVQGDSFRAPKGTGSYASRTMIMAGSALEITCNKVIDKGRRLAAHLWGLPGDDVVFEEGLFLSRATNETISVLELAEAARRGADLPEAFGDGLSTEGEFAVTEFHFPNGGQVIEVEIDPETGRIAVVSHAAVDDVGRPVNAMVVHGQIEGGIAQGLGQALLEHIVYDEAGQLLTGSLMDYALPRADDFPPPLAELHVVPSTTNPLGVKGCGESGVTGSLPAIANAVADALRRAGVVEDVTMPFTAEKIWRALRAVKRSASGR